MADKLKFDNFLNAIKGDIVAFRAISKMNPAGGPGDKVFPPTYAVADKAVSKYATETRRVEGYDESVPCVLIDSVASQANRMELALLKAYQRGQLTFPMISVDFSGESELQDLDKITVNEAPHRIADAIFRDSMLKTDDTPFRLSAAGRCLDEARVNNAAPLYRYCPTALLFGVWDSTGPRGGMGTKFTRCIVSEMSAINVAMGVKTESRLDPLQIGSKLPIYENKDGEWVVEESEAARKGKKPKPYKEGKASVINHGNIAPSIDTKAGGITCDYVLRNTVLSVSAIRQLCFPKDTNGQAIPRDKRLEADSAAHAALTALGLAAIVYHWQDDHFLRSRCHLVPTEELVIEAVNRVGQVVARYSPSTQECAVLLDDAVKHAAKHSLNWEESEIELKPAPKFAELIRRSRRLDVGEGSES